MVTSKSPLLFETVLQLHEIYMEGILILHVVHISRTRMIEADIYGLYRGNNLGGIIKGIYPLKFIPLHSRDLEISKELEGWIRSWWGPGLETFSPEGWFAGDKVKGITCGQHTQLELKHL